jgi:antirestriction protein
LECNEELEDRLGDEADECFIDEDGSFTDDEEIEEEMEEEYEEEQDYSQEDDEEEINPNLLLEPFQVPSKMSP